MLFVKILNLKNWRGTVARRRYKKLRAAKQISRFLKYYHTRKYIMQLNKLFM